MKRVLLVLVLSLTVVLCYKDRRAKDRNKSKFPPARDINLCSVDRDFFVNVRCLCTDGVASANATSVECWVFGPVSAEHKVWALIGKTQPHLGELNVQASNQGHYLQFVPRRLIQKLHQLKNITITAAAIEKLERHTFGNSTSLERIVISKNQIVTLEPLSISNLPNLIEVNLEENRLQEIRQNVFSNLPTLKYVFLNNNNISKIYDRAFTELNRVLEMDLSNNFLSDINQLTFFGLGELKYIDLSFNRIAHLEGFVFSELWNVEDLNLDYNSVEFISNRAFNGLQFLKTIRLSNNRLRRLSEGLLNTAFTLSHLDLRNNKLETLLFDAVKQFYSNLLTSDSSLLLSGNELSCDCRLKWLYFLRNETTNTHTRNALEELVCLMSAPAARPTVAISAVLSTPPTNQIHDNSLPTESMDYDSENGLTEERYLLSIPLHQLPCPVEYRPTPITIKQVTSVYSEATLLSSSSGAFVISSCGSVVAIILGAFLV